MVRTTLPADLIADADRLWARASDQAEYDPGERGEVPIVTLGADKSELYDLLEIAAASAAGWGIWLVNQARWCGASDGDGDGLLVYRSREKADAAAAHQSVMYALGPCEARPFDLSVEVDRG